MWRRKRLSWSVLETHLSPRGYGFPHHPRSTPPIRSMIRIKMPTVPCAHGANLRTTTLQEPYQETWPPSQPETGQGKKEALRKEHSTGPQHGSFSAKFHLSEAFQPSHIKALGRGQGRFSMSLSTKAQQGQPGSCWVRRGSTSQESKSG